MFQSVLNVLRISAFTALFVALCATCFGADGVRIQAVNPLDTHRPSETLAFKWSDLKAQLPSLSPDRAVVREENGSGEIVSQTVDLNGDGVGDELVFQWDFAPKQNVSLVVTSGESSDAKPQKKVHARYVKERMDDFAWENDRVAFRMYGPELRKETHGSGVDVWMKRVRSLVIDKWYASGDYHTDHGEGLDCFSVGTTRGCGGTAICDGSTMYVSDDYSNYRIIANGPVRAIFELSYDPWDAGGSKVSEVKRITIDAGQNLCRFESTFTCDPQKHGLDYAVGLVKRTGVDASFDTSGWMFLWGLADAKKPDLGCLGTGVVFDRAGFQRMSETGDHLYIVEKMTSGKPVTYYAGFGWTKSGDFCNKEDWRRYLEQFANRVSAPVECVIGGENK